MKKTLAIISMIGILILLTSGVLAKDYFLICFKDGEVIDFSSCNDVYAPKVCNSDLCPRCAYVGSKGFNCPATANPNPCNALGLNCISGEDPEMDITPPEVEINLPSDGDISNERKILVQATSNEPSTFKYSLDGEKWRTMCSRATITCEDRISFKEGENNLYVKAIDLAKNEGTDEISFSVDSKNPKIYRTYPKRRSFADGNFEVQFKEDNAKTLVLYYGNDEQPLDLENDCYFDKSKYSCSTYADLSKYNEEEIEYWFVLTDVAGNIDESKKTEINIDTSPPEINNPSSFYTYDEKYIYFNIGITEENLDEVFVSYEYEKYGREYSKEKRLCSRLKDGICEKKFRLKDYYENIQLNIIDEATNSIGVFITL
ncbi:MAG: hypothetical protein ABH811_00155 [archaeon]